jgi:hypothetical protein
MTTNETTINAVIEPSVAEPAPLSAEWWALRSAEELRDIIKRGFGVGPAYDGAVVETERRAREAVQRLREDEREVARGNAKVRLLALTGILAIVLAVGVLMRFAA